MAAAFAGADELAVEEFLGDARAVFGRAIGRRRSARKNLSRCRRGPGERFEAVVGDEGGFVDDQQVRGEAAGGFRRLREGLDAAAVGEFQAVAVRLGSVEQSLSVVWRASGWKGKFGHTSGV